MKFRTRLLVTSLTIVLVPLLLTSIAFLFVGGYVEDAEEEFGILDGNNLSISYTIENYSHVTEEVLKAVKDQIALDSSRLEDKEYLNEISGELNNRISYIIVRKKDRLYYTGNEQAAERIFEMLPEYGN
ncbi:MAG: two-component sensor histidine kinase, partial [Lachnospiraceae bacterium]|nr:two-component sensor histidine kinase [Lachnospiraceae bacterium]